MLRRLLILATLLGLAAASASAQLYPADNSLTTDEYVALGLPSIERKWSGVDYELAAALLDSIRRADITQLPRFESARSGPVFAWMTSPENFVPPGDSMVTRELLYAWMLSLTQHSPKILMTYASSNEKGAILDDELSELTGHVLLVMRRLIEVMMDLLEERGGLEVLDDPDNAGIRQMREGLHQSLVGSVQMLGETKQMREASRLRLARHLLEQVPALLPFLSPQAKVDLRNQFTTALAKKGNAGVKKVLAPLTAKLERAAKEK
jgi:hypothetical protein